MDDRMFDTFAGSSRSGDRAPLSLVHEEPDSVECVPEVSPAAAREEVKAEATLFAVAAATAAGAFAVVGLTTVVMLVAVPQHWIAALLFTALFVLAVVGAGVAVIWRRGALTIRRRSVRRVEPLSADVEAHPAGAGRRRRRRAPGA
jgi:hypothetical protein